MNVKESGSKEEVNKKANSLKADEQRGTEKKELQNSSFPNFRTGSRFSDKYHVVMELGQGNFGVVWNCWDLHAKKFVAVKINRSTSRLKEKALNEVRVLIKIHENFCDDARRQKLIELSDHFALDGDNQLNHCLVFDTIGIDLYNYMTDNKLSRGFPLKKAKLIFSQILEGLDYLHSVSRVIHTDLKLENILITYNNSYIQKKSTEATNNYLKSSEESRFISEEDKVLYYPWSTRTQRKVNDWEKNLKIKICDFGNALSADLEHFHPIQARPHRSIEVLIGAPYNTPADIWSAACVLFELTTGEMLFYRHPTSDFDLDESQIGTIMSVLGEIPEQVKNSGKNSNKFFNESGKLRNFIGPVSYSLYNQMVQYYEWRPGDAKIFSDFLRKMLNYDQNERPTAGECLKDLWFHK